MGQHDAEADLLGAGYVPDKGVRLPGEVLISHDCDQGKHGDDCGGKWCECTCHRPKGSEAEVPDRMTSHLNQMKSGYQ